jgi:capsular polysaccharide biosynthesis protein
VIATYLSILRRRVSLIVVVTLLLAPLAFLALTIGGEEYESEASLLLGSGRVVDAVLGQGAAFEEPERRMATELEVINGRVVARRAAERLQEAGWTPQETQLTVLDERFEAAPLGFSRAIEFVGTDPDPERARQLTESFVLAYLDFRQTRQARELEAIETELAERLETVEDELAGLDGALREAAILARYQTTASWLEEVRLLQTDVGSGVDVLSEASLPDEPVGAVPTALAAALSVLGALLFAVGVALVLDLIQDAVRTPEEAERLVSAPIFAQVIRPPSMDAGLAEIMGDPAHPTMAAARALRLRLEDRMGHTMPKRILVAGVTDEAEDSLAVGTALAAVSGRAGWTTLLIAQPIDDLHLGPLPELDPSEGSDRSVSQHPRAPLARPTTLANVWSAPATSTAAATPSTAGLLDGFSVGEALDALAPNFDVIVLVPPKSADVFEVSSLRRFVDVMALVCSLDGTPGRLLRRRVATLERNDALVDGVVLTSGRASKDARVRRRGDDEPSSNGHAAPRSTAERVAR